MEDLISYPRGWEWLKTVPIEDFNWLIHILSTMTDDTDTYSFIKYDIDINEKPFKIKDVQRRDLADFLNDYLGIETGITTHEHYIRCKALEIQSEEDYMLALPKIRSILGTNKSHPRPSNRELIKPIKEEILYSLDRLEQDLNITHKSLEKIKIFKLELELRYQNDINIEIVSL